MLAAVVLIALAPTAAGASSPRRRARTGPLAHITLTTANLAFALTPMRPQAFTSVPTPGVPVLHVDDTVRYQRISGFGAAMTDSSAWLINDELAPEARSNVLSELFGATGIHLNFIRVPIGASDFSATGVPYSYDDLPPGEADPDLAHFSIAHDEAYVIPALAQALRINPQAWILANPWSPPPWMKANDAFDDARELGTLLPQDYEPFANYFVRFIQAYQSSGILISAITPENEPGSMSPFPGMNLPPAEQAQFIAQNLEPALAAAGLHPAVYGYDSGAVLTTPQFLLQSGAAPDLAGIAWHCYGGAGVMSELHAEYPAVNEIVSECSPGIVPYKAAEMAISSTRNWASAVALWNLALDPAGGPVEPNNSGCPGCTGLVTISEQTHTVTFRASYYQLGQLSTYVQPGAVRIESDRWVTDFVTPSGGYGITPGLDNVAFLNPDGSKVLVAYDNSPMRIKFTIAWRGHYLTSSLRPGATVTFVWR
jgi:glucosylceramidase